MTARDYAYWCQGFFELAEPGPMSADQVAMMRRHLALVFKHEIDPSIDKGDPNAAQQLQAVHDGALSPHLTPIQGFPLKPSTGDVVYRC